MPSPHTPLQRSEAIARSALLGVLGYDVALDLAADDRAFGSVTTIGFRSGAGRTFVDVRPAELRSAYLDGVRLDPTSWSDGRLPLSLEEGEHELVVDAVMAFRSDGEGLHRSVDPADGRHYVYGMSFLDAAPTIFACFDQPDLKAPYSLHVRAPEGWVVIGNAPGIQVEPGVWEFERSCPLATYGVTVVAGPYHLVRDEHDGIPLGLSARASLATVLEKDAEELFTLTRQGFDELHRLLGIRYAFGDYHQAFVPDFNAGAMENPGCVTLRDRFLFSSRASRSQRIQRANTIEHELAHQWFGNLVTPAWWDDLWLNESFAEYLGTRVTAAATTYDDVLVEDAYARRQWGLIGDQGPNTHPVAGAPAVTAAAALQDFDGISYVKGCAVLRQLNTALGDGVFLAGIIDMLQRHRFSNATLGDLLASWERSGATTIGDLTASWLRTAGADRIELDRETGTLRRTSPTGGPESERTHRLHAAIATEQGWQIVPIELSAPTTYVDVADRPVILDPFLETWAATLVDDDTLRVLPDLMSTMDDPIQRAATWSNVRSALHNAAIDPEAVMALVLAAPPVEDLDDSERRTMAWVHEWVLPTQPEPDVAELWLHQVLQERIGSANPGSDLQFSTFRAMLATARDPQLLNAWLGGKHLPDGVQIDLELRWRIISQLAPTGTIDVARLDHELRAEPSATASVWHARSRAALPTAEAKAWAWSCFTAAEEVTTYELEAAGRGMWQPAQADLTAPYIVRYCTDVANTATVRSGWTLAAAVEWFFPRTSLAPATIARAEKLLNEDSLAPTIKRRIADLLDVQQRKLNCLRPTTRCPWP